MARLDLIVLRTGTSAQWSSANPILSRGEPGYAWDTEIFKIGNGTDAWDDLDPVNGGALFLGVYTSLANLQSAHPTAESGQYAIVDSGSGVDATQYIWDEDEEWVAGSGGGGSFSTITGDPYDNPNLETALNDKSDAVKYYRSGVTGAHTLDSLDLGYVNEGKPLHVPSDNSGALTVPTNASVAFPIGVIIEASGFTGSVIASGGVTITGTRGDLTFPSGEVIALEKTGTNTWLLHNGIPHASTTVRGLVEKATSSQITSSTDTGETGAQLFVGPTDMNNRINSLIAAQISHSDLNLTGL